MSAFLSHQPDTMMIPRKFPIHTARCFGLLRFLFAAVVAACGLRGASAEETRNFDVPAGAAEVSLKLFAEQAGRGVIFSTDSLKGIRTNAVKGTLSAQQAMEQLIARTPLKVTFDEQTRAFAVVRTSASTASPPSAPGNKTAANGATSASNQPANANPTVVLSPFEVRTERDYGYQATSTLSGGRLATDLDKTPAAVTVLTREFLDDIGALSVQEALQWTTNGVAANESDVTFEGGSGTARTGVPELANGGIVVRTRGIRDSSVARNYFVWLVDSHSYNTERIDISRGPNALLFGDASSGGLVNITTKRARQQPSTEFTATALSTGGGLVTADVNRPVNDTLSVRFNALLQDMDGFKDFQRDRRKGAFLTATWTPAPHTQLRIEGEWGRRNRRMPLAYWLDQTSNWNQQYTVAAPLPGAAPAGVGAARLDTGAIQNQPYMVLDVANPAAGFTDWQGFARTGGPLDPAEAGRLPAMFAELNPLTQPIGVEESATLGGPRTYPVLPDWEWNANLGARRVDQDYYTASGFFERRFADRLFVEVAGNVQSIENSLYQTQDANRITYDINRVLPSGAPNPNFLKPYVESSGFRIIHAKRTIWETRASAVYVVDTEITRHRIGLLASYRERSDTDTSPRFVRTNGPSPDLSLPENLLRFRSYLDERAANVGYLDIDRSYSFGATDARFANYASSGARGASGSGAYNASDSRLWSAQIFAAGEWLRSGRIHTVAGLRRDNLGTDAFGVGAVDPVTHEILGTSKRSSSDSYFTSPSFGAVVRILPWLSVFGNYSESFVESPVGVNVNGDQIDPRRGKGRDFGIKINLLGGRITGSAGYYNTFEENNRIANEAVGNAINAIWEALGQTTRVIPSSPDTQRASATGYELDLTANIRRNWTLLLNVGVPTSELEAALPGFRGYIARHRNEWEAAAANPATPAEAAQMINDRLALIDSRFDTLSDGRPVAGVADWNANLFTRYRFTSGFLKNLTIGGGVNLVARRFIGTRTVGADTVFDYSDGYERYTALLAYDMKLRGSTWKLQLNVDNVLDDDGFRYTALNPNGVGLQFRLENPRSFRFSASSKF